MSPPAVPSALELASTVVFDAIDQPVSVFEDDGCYRYINRAGLQLLGLSADAVMGRSYLALFPDLATHPFHEAFQKVATGASELERLEFFYAPTGTWSSQRIHRAGTFVFVLWEDVTARKTIEKELETTLLRAEESERQFRVMIEHMPQLAWTARADGFVDYYNPRWYEFTGTTPQEMEGWGWQSVHDPAILPQVMREWQSSVGTGQRFEMDFPLRRHDGVFRWFLTRVSPVRDDAGVLVRWVGINTEIDDQKTAIERLDDTLESMGDAFFLVDREWRIVRVNRHQEEISRVPRSESLGRNFWELFPEARKPSSKYWQEYNRVMAERVLARFVEHYAPLDLWTEVDAFPSREGGIAVFFRDVSQRRRAEQALSEERAMLEAVFREAPIGLAVLDSELRYRRLNSVLAQMNGIPIEAHLGRSVRDVLPDFTPAAADMLRQVMRTGVSLVGIEISGPAGSTAGPAPRVFRASYFPVRADNAVNLGAVVEDITDDRNATAEVQRALAAERHARAEAEEATRIKDEFLATLSHELRTPLNAILGWGRMLQSGSVSEDKVPKALDAIVRNAVAQNQLVDDLLDVSRIITGNLRLTVEPVDITMIIEAAIDGVRPAAGGKGVRLEALLDPDAGPIAGDPGRLQQIIWNLLTNAVKFTPRGGRVHVTLRREESAIEIAVADTGAGIAADFLPLVFHRFRQEDGSMTRKSGGLGLGLAIVKHLVELHGGTVEALSEGVGKGATFLVKIPLAPIRGQMPDRQAARQLPDDPRSLTCPKELEGLRVLVVDDEQDAREMLRAVLESCAATVTTASSAAEALERVLTDRPDVIVSDIGMPGEDGYSFVRKLRALSSDDGGRIPAVALTAYARPEDRTRALSEGFQNHASKPVDPQELVIVIANLAGRYG